MLGKSPSLPWLVGAVGPEKARRRLTSSASSVSAVRRNINGGNKNGIFSRHNLTDAAVLGIAKATDSIGSDFEKARVLLQIVAAHPMGKTTQQAILEAAGHIGSDHASRRRTYPLIFFSIDHLSVKQPIGDIRRSIPRSGKVRSEGSLLGSSHARSPI